MELWVFLCRLLPCAWCLSKKVERLEVCLRSRAFWKKSKLSSSVLNRQVPSTIINTISLEDPLWNPRQEQETKFILKIFGLRKIVTNRDRVQRQQIHKQRKSCSPSWGLCSPCEEYSPQLRKCQIIGESLLLCRKAPSKQIVTILLYLLLGCAKEYINWSYRLTAVMSCCKICCYAEHDLLFRWWQRESWSNWKDQQPATSSIVAEFQGTWLSMRCLPYSNLWWSSTSILDLFPRYINLIETFPNGNHWCPKGWQAIILCKSFYVI